MWLDDLSNYDTYFICPMASGVVDKHATLLNPYLTKRIGEDWRAQIATATEEFRAAVEAEIKEGAEVTVAIEKAARATRKFNAWRRAGEAVANGAPKGVKEYLLRAVGYGLGSPESPKERKDFLLSVSPLMEVHKDAFLSAGLDQDAIDYPATTLKDLEGARKGVAEEKDDVTVAAKKVARRRAKVVGLLDAVNDAANVALTAAIFKEDDAALERAEGARSGLDHALLEARVQSRKASTEKPVPPDLIVVPAPAPSSTDEEGDGPENG